MKNISKLYRYFTTVELTLWGISLLLLLLSHFLFHGSNWMTTVASMIGVSALIFIAKGNPIGQFLMIGFSIVYGIISYSYAYYGEMITYLGMSAPMAFVSLISWLRNPYRGKRSEVRINRLKGKEVWLLLLLSLVLSVLFYWVFSSKTTSKVISFNVQHYYFTTFSQKMQEQIF